jgi:hypothetical protein
MDAILLLAILICPAVMGMMIFFVMRVMRGAPSRGDPAEGPLSDEVVGG